MKKILLSLVAVLLICTPSSADFIYATSTGSIGTIKFTTSNDIASPSIQYAGNISSPFLTSYWNGNGTSIALIARNAGLSGDIAYVFSPNGLEQYSRSTDIKGVYGTELADYAENGYSLFLTSGAKIYEVETSSFKMLNSFDCNSLTKDDTYTVEVVNIDVDSTFIHVIISDGVSMKYLRFEGQLNDKKSYFMSADVPYGTSSLLSTTNNYPVIGHSLGIDTMNTNRKFYRVMSSDYPVKAICPDSSGGIFYADQEKSGDIYVNTIMHLVRGDDNFLPEVITSYSPNIELIRDNSKTEFFAAMTDEAIRVISYNGRQTTSREYGVTALGGRPVSIVAANVSGYDSNSSSSGCDFSGLGIIAAGLLAFMMRRK